MLKSEKFLTYRRLRQVLLYNPDTGVLRWKVQMGGRGFNGHVAGCESSSHPYIRIMIDKRPYRAHRVIWCWMTGHWPKHEIDHEDLNKRNNRWLNLREATHEENTFNRGPRRNNKLQSKGVHRHGRGFRASIKAYGKCYSLGTYRTIEEAAAAYENASLRLHGKFARSV